MRKRITSLLLVLALCLTLLPTAALAEASSLAAQEARGGTENGEDYTVGEDTAVRARTRAAATGEVVKISTRDDLKAFRDRVNGGESGLNAVLLKDVSYTSSTNVAWESIRDYTGTFDGNGHTITLGLGNQNQSLFRSISSGGIVQDLTVRIYSWGSYICTQTGSIAYSNAGTIQRCQALDWTGEKNIGGIVYQNESDGVVKDCRVGTLKLSKTSDTLVGGIAFINNGLIQDCYISGKLQSIYNDTRTDLSSATAIVRTNRGTVKNCYYWQYDSDTAVAGTPMTADEFASGKVAYLLNGGKTEPDSVWRQNLPNNKDGIDTDGLPVTDASHGRVYYDSESGSYYSLVPHLHGEEELTAWQETDSLPSASGSYYLTDNVTLTSVQEMDEDVTLCLNGHNIVGDVTVTGGSFTLTDCGSGSVTGNVTVNEGGSFTLEDCALSGKIENNGTLTISGGSITASEGSAVTNRGTFTMASGTITATGGTGVANSGTLTMNGGTVTGCDKGVENNGTMAVSGKVKISGNTNGNLLLPDGKTVTVGALDSTANIGVTAEKQSDLTADGSIRLTSGGAAHLARFFADDAAAYGIFADGEDLVMRLRSEHIHCVCGHPADSAGEEGIGNHTEHEDMTFQPWTSGNDLPTAKGNYYLTQNVVLDKTKSFAGEKTARTVVLCLNGYSISVKDGSRPISVSGTYWNSSLKYFITLTLTDCAAQQGSVVSTSSQAVSVSSCSTVNIFAGTYRGGIYTGSKADCNAYIYGGKFTDGGTGITIDCGNVYMYDGEVSGNGCGVKAGSYIGTSPYGSFYMYGGKITDNHGRDGGGVYINYSFYMYGGEVSNNTATGNGGGIYMNAGYFTMSGGKITGNSAGGNGGGIYSQAGANSYAYGHITMSNDAEISNNHANGNGGGVFLGIYEGTSNGDSNGSSLTMSGSSSITGNTCGGEGGGVYADAGDLSFSKSDVYVMDSVRITGNKKGEEDNNLYLSSKSAGATIRGDLDEIADIRVTTETKPSGDSSVTIAKKYPKVDSVTVPDGVFKVDGADGTIRIGEDGSTVKLVPHTHVWTYALKSGTTDTVTAVCSGCNASGGNVTIKAPAELTYSGGDKEATLDDQLTTGVTVSASDIGYRMGASLTGELPAGSYPRNAGTYTASITLGEGTGAVTASVTYTIGKKDLTITANGNTITYGDTASDKGVTYRGFVDGEDAGVLGGSLTYIFSYIPGSDTGLYIIAPQGVTSDNYEITFVPGTLTVGQREVTLTWHDYENRTYGDGKTVTATAGNLLEADAGKVQVTVRDGGWNKAGSWVARADGLTGDKAGNYKLPTTNLTQNYFIALAGQTLTFERSGDQTVVYGRTLTNPAANDRAGQGGSDVTYTSSDETIATVDENGTVTARSVGTVTITAAAAAMDGKYSNATAAYTLTVEPKTLTKDDLTYTGSITKVYDGSNSAPSDLTVFVKPTSLVGSDTLTITGSAKYNSKDVKDADTITFTPDAITTGNYRLAADQTLTVTNGAAITPRVLTVGTVNTTPKKYDGNNNATSYITGIELNGIVSGETLRFYTSAETGGDYGITGTKFDNANVGQNKQITGKVVLLSESALASNYTFKVDGKETATVPFTATGEITEADGSNLKTVELTQKYTDASEHTYTPDWSGLPNGQTWSYGCESSSTLLIKKDVSAESGKLTYAISGGKAGDIVTITLKASCNNYEDFTITLNITLTEKDDQAALKLTGGTTVVYGETLQLGTSGGSGTGAVTYTVTEVDGKATIDANGVLTPVQVGTVTVTAAKAGDDAYNDVTSAAVTITITKATPTGEPKYTEITTSGKTLADAALTLDGSTLKPNTGTLEWVDDKGNARPGDTKVEANTSYKWRFTPADANYTTLTGSIELYHKSSSGGGGWYYTYHTIKATAGANGSISPFGWISIREGWDQTFTITPDKGYAVAKVLVDGKSVGAVTSYTFKNVTKDHTIEAVFMKSNGNPQTGVFVDVPEDSYYEEAVDWAVENGITNGVSSDRFDPDGLCTRAQIVTFLWRAAGSPVPKSTGHNFTDVKAGSYYEQAVLWAVENGITVGTSSTTFSPDATCTRAQAVTFLYRASDSPAVSGSAAFSDVATDAYYADAVAWAEKKGITTGIGGGLFGSNNDCTRAQIVTFLWRAMAE